MTKYFIRLVVACTLLSVAIACSFTPVTLRHIMIFLSGITVLVLLNTPEEK